MNAPQSRNRGAIALILLIVGLAVAFIVWLSVGGAGGVSGKVTYKGKPVPIGYVVFLAGGELSDPVPIINGEYRTEKPIPAGEVLVAVISDDPKIARKEIVSKGKKIVRPEPVRPWPKELEKNWFPIPPHYVKHLDSGLTLTVRRGENTFDINLVDTPPAK